MGRRVIREFPLLAYPGSSFVAMPMTLRPLTLQLQDGRPTLWAIVDPKAPCVDRLVTIVGTGHDLGDYVQQHDYLGTVQDARGFAWHYFLDPTPIVKALP